MGAQLLCVRTCPPIQAALAAAGNGDATIAELPGLNHLFQTAKTGALSEYIQIDETFAPSALQLLSDWIVKHARAHQAAHQP